MAASEVLRLVFRAVGLGATTIGFGSNYAAYEDGLTIEDPFFGVRGGIVTGASIKLNVIPEPGTRLLLGWGLGLLANRGKLRAKQGG